jgi:MFS family permease
MFKYISRNVWILSLVSFFTDIASEMLYPIMPLYLKSIGFTVVSIGVLEGFAEGITAISKGYFGLLSDKLNKRKPFIQIGYLLSGISKPLMAVSSLPVVVFIARSADRLGKGVRTAARDALLAAEATPQTKGKIFGFHRSADTLGATIGPLIALLFLQFYPNQYISLFLWAFIPSAFAIMASALIKEKFVQSKLNVNTINVITTTSLFSFIPFWKKAPSSYKRLVIGLLIFTLFNSSDVFLLLKAKEIGLNDSEVVGVYIFYNLIYALFSFPLGVLSDKIGLKTVFSFGLFLFVIVYGGMAFKINLIGLFILFFIYGIFSASTEGVAKAWISSTVNTNETATAIGTFAALQSIVTMISSALAGILWFNFSSNIMFFVASVCVFITMVYFIFYVPKPKLS